MRASYRNSKQFRALWRIAINTEIKKINNEYEILPTTLPLEDLMAGSKKVCGRKRIGRQQNPFILFRKDVHAELNSGGQKLTVAEISRIASERWWNASDAVKKFFAVLAQSVNRIHKELFPHYQYKPMANRKINKKNGKKGRGRKNTLGSQSKSRPSHKLPLPTSSEENSIVTDIDMDVNTDANTSNNKPLKFSSPIIFMDQYYPTGIPSRSDETQSSDVIPSTNVTPSGDVFSTNNIPLANESISSSDVSPRHNMNDIFLIDNISSSDLPCTQFNYLPTVANIPCDEYVNNGNSHSIFEEFDPFDFSSYGDFEKQD